MFLRIAILTTGLIGFGAVTVAAPFYSSKAGEVYRNLPPTQKSGTLYLRLATNPKVLNPVLASDVDSLTVSRHFLYATLLSKDYQTYEAYPALAEKLEVSKDKKVMTFTLRKEATWDDGTPITTEDVEFTFKTIMDPKVDAAPIRAYLEGYTFEKVDSRVFRFKVEKPNVNTVSETIDDFIVIQKKQFQGASDFNRAKGIMEPVTSGPYRVKSFVRDQKLELELKKDWWGFKTPEFKNQFNFDSIVFRIISDSALAYEKFIKGEIDVLEMSSEVFGTKVKGIDKDRFGSDPSTPKAVWAKHFMTDAPSQYTYVGWNLRRPMFQSKKTRQALAQLINYDEIVNVVYHSEGMQCLSPFGTRTQNTPPDQKSRAFKFDPKKALALLKEDGWSDMDGTNTLSKMIDGKKVKFEFVLRYNSENPMRAKVAQMVKEQFKKAGITVNVQALEFNAFLDLIDNRSFDAIVMGWARGALYSDSKQIWHSKSELNRGSNFVAYSNPEADKLIDQASSETDIKKHYALNQKIAKIIYDDQPYAFLVETPGFMAGLKRDKLKSAKWALRYDDVPPVWMYAPQN
jgi:peptide/nickel transport system substrate-binding protein/microcin C transport system substrate-binding protein